MDKNLVWTFLIIALFCPFAFAQQSVTTAPVQAPNLTAPGPQRQQPAGGKQQPIDSQGSRTATIPAQGAHAPYSGTLEGYVY